MSSNALAAMEDLDGVGRVAHVDLFARVAIRHRVIVLVKLDVIVRPDTCDLPLRVLIGLLGQGPECRTIDFVEDATAGAGQFLEGPVVHIAQAEEALVAQAGEDPLCTKRTDSSAFGLSVGFLLRAGITATEKCLAISW